MTAAKQSRGKVGHLAAPQRIINSMHDFDEPTGILSTGRVSSVVRCLDAILSVYGLIVAVALFRAHPHILFSAMPDPAAVV